LNPSLIYINPTPSLSHPIFFKTSFSSTQYHKKKLFLCRKKYCPGGGGEFVSLVSPHTQNTPMVPNNHDFLQSGRHYSQRLSVSLTLMCFIFLPIHLINIYLYYYVCRYSYCTDINSEVCHPRCVFKLYGAVNSVKNTTINTWLNDGVY